MSKLILFFLALSFIAGATEEGLETIPEGEAEQIKQLVGMIEGGIGRHRDAHAKSHGCVDDLTVEVNENLDKKLQVGLFQPGATYKALARFSPGSGNSATKDVVEIGGVKKVGLGGQGFALKIIPKKDTEIPSLPHEKFFLRSFLSKTLDILTINHNKEFFVPDVKSYPAFFTASIKAAKNPAKRAEIMQAEYISKLPKETQEEVGALLASIAKHETKNILQETFGSWVPSMYGKNSSVKYRLRLCDQPEAEKYRYPKHIKELIEVNYRDVVREVLVFELRQRKHVFCLDIQFHKKGFPSVEAASSPWPEDKEAGGSPYVNVAKVIIPKKENGKELTSENFCELLSFNPGHAPKDLRPIGGIQRARVPIYQATHVAKAKNRGYSEVVEK